jgi:hypothetical protein
MAHHANDLADVLPKSLGKEWKQAKGRLHRFLASAGLKGGECSQSLQIFPAIQKIAMFTTGWDAYRESWLRG